jgi:hypothetical protein
MSGLLELEESVQLRGAASSAVFAIRQSMTSLQMTGVRHASGVVASYFDSWLC